MAKKERTLRQKMRAAAESKLEELLDHGSNALLDIAEPHGIDHGDLARMLSGSTQTKTLRDKLVTQLADEAEKDLVKLWNNQQSLDLPENKDDK